MQKGCEANAQDAEGRSQGQLSISEKKQPVHAASRHKALRLFHKDEFDRIPNGNDILSNLDSSWKV